MSQLSTKHRFRTEFGSPGVHQTLEKKLPVVGDPRSYQRFNCCLLRFAVNGQMAGPHMLLALGAQCSPLATKAAIEHRDGKARRLAALLAEELAAVRRGGDVAIGKACAAVLQSPIPTVIVILGNASDLHLHRTMHNWLPD